MNNVATDMVDHFLRGKGEDYSSSVLTEKIKEHDNSKAYVDKIRDKVNDLLVMNAGNAYKLNYNDMTRRDSLLVQTMNERKIYSPFFLIKLRSVNE